MTLHGDKICSKCGKDWMRCDCQNYHPPVYKTNYTFKDNPIHLDPTMDINKITLVNPENFESKVMFSITRTEVKALYKVLESQYIHQDHELAHQVIKKMYEFLKVQ